MPGTKINRYTFGNLTVDQKTTHSATSAIERQKFVRREVVDTSPLENTPQYTKVSRDLVATQISGKRLRQSLLR